MSREVSEERKKEIEKEKAQKRKELENIDTDDFINEITETEQGERYYSRKFRTLYKAVRQGLALINNKKKYKVIDNQTAYEEATELLNKFVEE